MLAMQPGPNRSAGRGACHPKDRSTNGREIYQHFQLIACIIRLQDEALAEKMPAMSE
jgi:hypothetical protein